MNSLVTPSVSTKTGNEGITPNSKDNYKFTNPKLVENPIYSFPLASKVSTDNKVQNSMSLSNQTKVSNSQYKNLTSNLGDKIETSGQNILTWEIVKQKQKYKPSRVSKTYGTNQVLELQNKFSIFEEQIMETDWLGNDDKEVNKKTPEEKLRNGKFLKKQKEKNKNKLKNKSAQNTNKCSQRMTLRWNRCKQCFSTHYPYPKFCRWATCSKSLSKTIFHASKTKITNQLKAEIEIHIARIEKRGNVLENIIMETFLQEEKPNQQFPDLIFENKDKRLRGGAKFDKVKKFVSRTTELNIVLNSLRSSRIYEQFNNHKKCSLEDTCGFCLLRSSMYKINNKKGRQTIIPIELESQLSFETQHSSFSIFEDVLKKAAASNQDFKKAISPRLMCKKCNEPSLETGEQIVMGLSDKIEYRKLKDLVKLKVDGIKRCCVEDVSYLGEDKKTCFFKGSSLNVDLLENLNFQNQTWKCVGAISENDVPYFRIENKWFKSNECHEIKNTEVKNIKVAIYDCIDMPGVDKPEEFYYQREELRKLREKTKTRKEHNKMHKRYWG